MEVQIAPQWRKSSYSGNGGGDCVEVGTIAESVAVRDTNDRGGVMLTVSANAWKTFLATIQ